MRKLKTSRLSKSEKIFSEIQVGGLNEGQCNYLKAIENNMITFVNGPAGVGKTHIATVYAIKEFLLGNYKKIIFSRPCVEAGEKIGYLPGNAQSKLEIYLTAITNTLEDTIGKDAIDRMTDSGQIVTMPIGFLRGVSFKNSYILLDEAQNTTPSQMRLFLTRIGENSKMVITGDSKQSDIGNHNGFVDALNRLQNIEGIGICELDKNCIVRHPIIAKIEERYEN